MICTTAVDEDDEGVACPSKGDDKGDTRHIPYLIAYLEKRGSGYMRACFYLEGRRMRRGFSKKGKKARVALAHGCMYVHIHTRKA